MKINLKKVLAVSEHPGLYHFISESRNGMIVASMADKKRTCLSSRSRVTTLADIGVYSDAGELRLKEVLERIKNLSVEREVPDPKSEPALLRIFFEEVIPDYDRDRFYVSHMKKILEWFHLLRNSDALDFEEEEEQKAAVAAKEEPTVET